MSMDHGAKIMDVEEEKKHICCKCGKGFKSGKALGGHKRIHAQEARPKMVYSVATSISEDGKMEVACRICHKKFPSMKALYGHMRYHPNRGWKGVIPPHVVSSDSTLSIDDDDENSEWENVLDLEESIKRGWSAKGKRGRESVLKDIDVENLLMLANIAEAVTLNGVETYDQKIIKKRMKKEIVVGAEEGVGGEYLCVTCNKSFTSYHALGGHRSTHNKEKILENRQARALLHGTKAIASPQGPSTSLNNGNNGDHVCNICQKRFPTGQALGGHKRCHWVGPVSPEATTVAPTAPAAGSSGQQAEIVQEVIEPKRRFLEFDLNEFPPN